MPSRFESSGVARVALTFEGKNILNLDGNTLAIVNLCMVRENEATNLNAHIIGRQMVKQTEGKHNLYIMLKERQSTMENDRLKAS